MKTALVNTFKGVASDKEQGITFVIFAVLTVAAYVIAHVAFGFTIHCPKY